MLLKITESNAWENERWSYVIDLSKQEAASINWLMIFIRCANKVYDDAKEAAPTNNYGGPFSRPTKVFAASLYWFEFYDEILSEDDECLRLGNRNSNMNISKAGNYKSGGNFVDRKLSFAKIKSAAVTIRDKKENKLYKDFESAFHSKKLQTA